MKNIMLILIFTLMPLIGFNQGCGWDGEAYRGNGTQPCIFECISNYERCESYFNDRYRDKLAEVMIDSFDTVCETWFSWIFGGTEEPHNSAELMETCGNVWTRTADIDQEHFSNLQIAINFLNRCVNTCDSY